MKTDWSNYSITYDGITYDLQYRGKVNLIACEDYTPNSPSPDYPSPIVSTGDPSGIDFAVTGYAAQTYSAHRDVILRSLPDGTCDTWGALTGDVPRNIGRYVFTGNETISKRDNAAVNCGVFYMRLIVGARPVLCTHFKFVDWNYASTDAINSVSIDSGMTYVYVKIIGILTVTDFKSYLAAQYAAGTPVIVQYKLAEPTIEQIDPIPLPTYPRYTTLNCSEQMTAKVRVVDIC